MFEYSGCEKFCGIPTSFEGVKFAFTDVCRLVEDISSISV